MFLADSGHFDDSDGSQRCMFRFHEEVADERTDRPAGKDLTVTMFEPVSAGGGSTSR